MTYWEELALPFLLPLEGGLDYQNCLHLTVQHSWLLTSPPFIPSWAWKMAGRTLLTPALLWPRRWRRRAMPCWGAPHGRCLDPPLGSTFARTRQHPVLSSSYTNGKYLYSIYKSSCSSYSSSIPSSPFLIPFFFLLFYNIIPCPATTPLNLLFCVKPRHHRVFLNMFLFFQGKFPTRVLLCIQLDTSLPFNLFRLIPVQPLKKISKCPVQNHFFFYANSYSYPFKQTKRKLSSMFFPRWKLFQKTFLVNAHLKITKHIN